MEGGSNGVTDMFPVLPFNSTMRDEHCRERWNVTPRRNWLDVLYWGEGNCTRSRKNYFAKNPLNLKFYNSMATINIKLKKVACSIDVIEIFLTRRKKKN